MSRFISLSSTRRIFAIGPPSGRSVCRPRLHRVWSPASDVDRPRDRPMRAPAPAPRPAARRVSTPPSGAPAPPSRSASARSSGVRSFAVTTRTGIVRQAGSARSRSTKPKPSSSGIIRSSRIRSGARGRDPLQPDRARSRPRPRPSPRAGASAAASRGSPGRPPPPAPGAVAVTPRASRRTCLRSGREQPLALDRLGQVVGGAQRVAEVAVVQHRQHDDRDVGRGRVALERAEDRPAVHPRHQHVQGHQRPA